MRTKKLCIEIDLFLLKAQAFVGYCAYRLFSQPQSFLTDIFVFRYVTYFSLLRLMPLT